MRLNEELITRWREECINGEFRQLIFPEEWRELCNLAIKGLAESKYVPSGFIGVGFVNRDGGVTWEPNKGPSDLEPGQLVYVSHISPNAAPQGSVDGQKRAATATVSPPAGAASAPSSIRPREGADGAGLKGELEFLRDLAEILGPLDGRAPDVKRALDAISTMRVALSGMPSAIERGEYEECGKCGRKFAIFHATDSATKEMIL